MGVLETGAVANVWLGLLDGIALVLYKDVHNNLVPVVRGVELEGEFGGELDGRVKEGNNLHARDDGGCEVHISDEGKPHAGADKGCKNSNEAALKLPSSPHVCCC